MRRIIIAYIDTSGLTTKGEISQVNLIDERLFDAYCHLRQCVRSFNIGNIVEMIDAETGECLNPYEYLYNEYNATRKSISTITWSILPAIKALKIFILTTRGFRKKEQDLFTNFVMSICNLSMYSNLAVDNWLKSLFCGDVYAIKNGETQIYTELLNKIPHELKLKCKKAAYTISLGSGRVPISEDIVTRIERDFG